MSFLAKIVNGVQKNATMNTLYGPPGIGKTTFFSRVPNGLILDIESGSKALDVPRLGVDVIPDIASLQNTITELLTTKHDIKALAIDSITQLEYYINKQVCIENGGVKEISEIPYGKGPFLAIEKLKEFLSLLAKLKNEKQMDLWLIGHSFVKKFSDPTLLQQYDRFTIQGNEKFSQEIIRQSDNVYFVKYEVDLTIDKQTKKARGVGDGSVRTMFTRYNAAFDAKTRLNLPESLPFDYEAYAKAVSSYGPKASPEVVKDIQSLLLKLQAHDPEFVTMAKEKLSSAGTDNQKLQRIKEKLLDATRAL